MEKLEGLIAAPHTLFNSDGSVAYDMIKAQCNMLIKNNVKGAFISGSTGEGVSCSVAERLQIMEEWHKAAGDKLKLIVHTGCLALEDIKVLAERANALKVFATSIVPPNYFKPPTINQLVDFCQAAASYAPDCGFYCYNTTLVNYSYSMAEFLKLSDGKIPNLYGIKFNSPDLYEFQKCLNLFDKKYDIVYGVDEFFTGALAMGAKGFIGSTYNYMAKVYYDIWEAFDKHDLESSNRLMKRVCAAVDVLCTYGGIAAGKAALKLHGIDYPYVRLPLRNLSDDELAIVHQTMENILK